MNEDKQTEIECFEKIIVDLIKKKRGLSILARLVSAFRAITFVALNSYGPEKTMALFDAINQNLRQQIDRETKSSNLH